MRFFKSFKRPQHAHLFWVAILTALALVVFNQVMIQYMLQQKNSDARVLNMVGRQRMLSQKINTQVFQAASDRSVLPELRSSMQEWRQGQRYLVYGSEPLKLPACKNPKILLQLLYADQHIRISAAAVDSLLNGRTLNLEQFSVNQTAFLQKMETVATDLEAEAAHSLRLLTMTEIFLALFSLFVLVSEFLFIYKPVLDQLYRQKKIVETENALNLATKNKLEAILNSTSDANVLIGKNFEILSINKTGIKLLRRFFNRTPQENQNILDYIMPTEVEAFRLNFADALEGKTTKIRKRLHFNHESCWFEIAYYPVYNEQSQIIGVSFNAKDINIAQKRFEKLQEISWTHSHEIRRPVSNILGLMQLIEWDKLDDDNKKLFQYFDSVTKDLDRVIHKVVGVSSEKDRVLD